MALSDNLKAYYKFDTAPGLLVDSGGNALTLTNVNTVVTDTGKIGSGQSAKFVAASAQLLKATSALFSPATGFTLGGWFKLATLPTGGNVSILAGLADASGSHYSYLLYIGVNAADGKCCLQGWISNNGSATIGVSDVNGTAVATQVLANVWYFGTLTWDGTAGVTCQINNTSIASNGNAAAATIYDDSAQPFALGNWGTTPNALYFLDGWLDGWAFFNTRKSSGDLTTWYAAGAGLDIVGGGGSNPALPFLLSDNALAGGFQTLGF